MVSRSVAGRSLRISRRVILLKSDRLVRLPTLQLWQRRLPLSWLIAYSVAPLVVALDRVIDPPGPGRASLGASSTVALLRAAFVDGVWVRLWCCVWAERLAVGGGFE